MRRWLEKQPRPASIRGDADGEERIVRIGTQRAKWADAEAALHGCTHCEALDSDGAILRVWDADAAMTEAARPSATQSDVAAFARILADASDRAALRHADAYRLAYEQQVQLVRILSERLAGLEKAWHRLLMSLPAEAGSDGNNEALISQILAAHMMAPNAGGSPDEH